MAKNISLTNYHSTIGNLYLTPLFTYEISIYKIFKNYVELAYHNIKYSTRYREVKKEVSYKKYKNFTLMICVELIGAPKSYLLQNHFSPMSSEEYKELVTKRFKRKKKKL